MNETISIENDGSTKKDDNKTSDTTTANPTEGDGNGNIHIDSSKTSELSTNESNDEIVNDISESMTSLSIVIVNDVSTTNNKNKTSNTTNINPTESDESENSNKNTSKTSKLGSNESSNENVNENSGSKTDLSVAIDKDVFTTNNNNKISNTTKIYPTEGDESESSHKNTSKTSKLGTNESSNEKVNGNCGSKTDLSVVIEKDVSTTNNNNKTSNTTNIYPTEGDESKSSNKNTSKTSKLGTNESSNEKVNEHASKTDSIRTKDTTNNTDLVIESDEEKYCESSSEDTLGLNLLQSIIDSKKKSVPSHNSKGKIYEDDNIGNYLVGLSDKEESIHTTTSNKNDIVERIPTLHQH